VHSPVNDATGAYKIAKSIDSGITWTELPTPTADKAITDLAVVAPTTTTRRLWAIANNRLYKLDHGSTLWAQVFTPCDGGLMVMAIKDTLMLAGGSAGVCSSINSGATWTLSTINNAASSSWVGVPGPTWWQTRYLGVKYVGVTDFAVAPAGSISTVAWMTVINPDTTANQPNAGLYKTTDNGATWSQVSTFGPGLYERNFIRTVAMSPVNPNLIVVGTSPALYDGGYFRYLPSGSTIPIAPKTGAWVSTNGGVTWTASPQNTGLAWPFVTRLRFAGGATPRLWGISPGQGLIFSSAP
jgi:hypothetical protein